MRIRASVDHIALHLSSRLLVFPSAKVERSCIVSLCAAPLLNPTLVAYKLLGRKGISPAADKEPTSKHIAPVDPSSPTIRLGRSVQALSVDSDAPNTA